MEENKESISMLKKYSLLESCLDKIEEDEADKSEAFLKKMKNLHLDND